MIPRHRRGFAIRLLGWGRLLDVHSCPACGAIILEAARDQHGTWHRAELERIERAQAAAVAEALVRAVPATLSHISPEVWR